MNFKILLTLGIAVSIAVALGWRLLKSPTTDTLPAGRAEHATKSFSYAPYADVLDTHVNDEGMVDYEALQTNRMRLDTFAVTMAQLSPKEYDQWSEEEKIAFWINAYNSFTLVAIINHYPIKPSFFKSMIFPKNSIRQIPGVWDELAFTVMGRKVTLDEVEHEILRQKFREPRIHVALVCAALSCPPLRNEPFLGNELNQQLEDQADEFLSRPEAFRIDRVEGRVLLSSIFKWFAQDFVPVYSTEEGFADHQPAERAVLNFISLHLDDEDADYLKTARYRIEYLDYDWSLNEQTSDKPIS